MYRIFFAFFGLITILVILLKVRRQKLSEEKSIYWVIGGVLILLLSIFPKAIDLLSEFLGINHPPSLLFLLASLFLFYTIFRQDEEITQIKEKLKELAQKNALLENSVSGRDKDK